MDRPATTINVGQNAAYDLWLTRHLQHASLHRLPSSQEAIDAFLAGEGDMVAGIRQPLEATARQHAGVRVLADNFTEIQQAICVARADVDRFHAVNDALSEWRADGSLQALIAGHRVKRTESRLRHPAHGAMPCAVAYRGAQYAGHAMHHQARRAPLQRRERQSQHLLRPFRQKVNSCVHHHPADRLAHPPRQTGGEQHLGYLPGTFVAAQSRAHRLEIVRHLLRCLRDIPSPSRRAISADSRK